MDQLLPTISWVDTSWLKNNLESDITILDVQPDVHDYIKEHIPESVYFNENHLRIYHKNLPTQYVTLPVIQQIFQSAGLQENKTVVIYGSDGRFSGIGDGLEQTMVAYSLARFGHSSIRILNGGLQSWINAGFPLSKKYPNVSISEFHTSLNNDLFVNYNQFLEIKDLPDTVIIDVRPRSIYQGGNLWSKPGHIPNAINLPWRLLMDHDNPRLLRAESFLKEITISRGAPPDKTIILYCGTGREATAAFLVFKYLLKYPSVKIYEGSFTEWVINPDNPTVTGPSPV
ncbi:MAG TPA: sulfurtransferase [Chitinispirillaceae bacterium]|nr:sulfurtransferase [Chitinispirillaceae bacterium]